MYGEQQAGGMTRSGATLVEVMLASVVLAVLALAGGAFIYRSRGEIGLQKSRRVAVELANARLEELMYDWTYAQVAAQVGTPINEALAINGRAGYQRRTTVLTTTSAHDECLHITVSMQYNLRNAADTIRFETLRGR